MSDAASANNVLGRQRWLILGVIALAQRPRPARR
jgi:hypothetical protein